MSEIALIAYGGSVCTVVRMMEDDPVFNHLFLVGEGGIKFARKFGFEDYDL